MKLRPLTDKEQKFAEVNHELVYSFLNENKLNRDEYYDVIVFGFIKAVQEYCSNPFKYKKFSTFAWRCMLNELVNYYQHISRKKRNTVTISIEDLFCQCECEISYYECVNEIKMDLLLHELARKLPEREMRIIRMRVRGDKLQDIARAEKLNFQQIGRLLEDIYPTVIKIIYE